MQESQGSKIEGGFEDGLEPIMEKDLTLKPAFQSGFQSGFRYLSQSGFRSRRRGRSPTLTSPNSGIAVL